MKKFHIYITAEERNLLIESLLSEKNNLLRQGNYTDGVDDVLLKFMKCKQKKVAIKYI